MNVNIAETAIGMQMAATQHSAQIAMLKKSHEMAMSMITMLDAAVRSAPAPAPAPAGMGTRVDKSA